MFQYTYMCKFLNKKQIKSKLNKAVFNTRICANCFKSRWTPSDVKQWRVSIHVYVQIVLKLKTNNKYQVGSFNTRICANCFINTIFTYHTWILYKQFCILKFSQKPLYFRKSIIHNS